MAALATAILRGSTSAQHLEEILSRGVDVADLDFRDPLGRSLIHLAAESNDVSALRWLLQENRVNPKAGTVSEGNTALHVAASEGHLEAATYLLEEASVSVAGVNNAGETALDVAVNGGYDDIVRLMIRHLRSPAPPPKPIAEPDAPAPLVCAATTGAADLGSASLEDSNTARVVRDGTTGSPGRRRAPSPFRQHTLDNEQENADKNTQSKNIGRGEGDTAAAAPAPENANTMKHAGGRTPPVDGRGVTGGGFFVAGAWSKAGVCSCFNIRHRHLLGKHGVVFDMGVCPFEVTPVQHVFITHGHLDHCGAIVSHARLRSLRGLPPGKYYMHAKLAAGMDTVRRAFEQVEGNSIIMDLVAVGPDDSIDLGQGCFVRPFLVQHRVEALGFALMRRRSAGLKQEYRDFDRKALGALKKRGVEICHSHETVEVVYTGDTVMAPLVALPQVWSARLLIMEVTYLDGDRAAAVKTHHIHVQDLLDNIDKLQGVEQLVVAHVSDRYSPYQSALGLLAAALPPSVINKVSVALGELGAPACLTFLEDYILDKEEVEAEVKAMKEWGGDIAGVGANNEDT